MVGIYSCSNPSDPMQLEQNIWPWRTCCHGYYTPRRQRSPGKAIISVCFNVQLPVLSSDLVNPSYLARMGTPGCGGVSPSLSMMSNMWTPSALNKRYTHLRPGMVIFDVA